MKNIFETIKKVYLLSSANTRKKNIQIHFDDKFLVSYPKSGNTWTRFIIANLLKEEGESIDFHSAIKYIPEIGTHDEIIGKMLHPRIMKSHSLYQKSFNNVIYIVRDPRDVYVSYFHYLKKKLPENITFSQFLRKSDIFPSRWHTHVESWVGKPNVSLVIKYEDLLNDTYNEVEKMTRILFREDVSPQKIRTAIELSSFANMKEAEKTRGRPFMNKEAEARATTFMRSGKQGDWESYFSEEDISFLLDKEGDMMRNLGYI